MPRASLLFVVFWIACGADAPVGPDAWDASDPSEGVVDTVSCSTDRVAAADRPACATRIDLPVVDGHFEVPPGTLSFAITAHAPDALLTTARLTGPGGDLVPGDWLETATVPICLACINRVRVDEAVHSVLVPIQPAAQCEVWPGTWTVAVTTVDSQRVPQAAVTDVQVAAWVGSAAIESARVRLDVHLVGARGRASGAAEDPLLASLIDEAGMRLAPAGLTLDVRWYDAPEARPDARLESLREDLFAHWRGQPDAIPVYLVSSLVSEAGTSFGGLSPVVGPWGDAVSRSGVVVKVGLDAGGTLAHEIGHWLGLWHVFEASQTTIKDPLPDTPTFGDDNLMTPGMAGPTLTAGQVEVVRRHPIVTPVCP